MADLDNLLDDINNDDGSFTDDDQQQMPSNYGGESEDDDDNLERPERASSVPTALAAAAATRRQLEENDGFGAGDDEASGAQGRDGMDDGDIDGDDEDGDGRHFNPDYEQLKALWTSELACPELLPHDAETVVQNVDELEKKEEIIDELLQRSKQQRQSREASGELASLVAQITKMDSDRTRFMLVDLARTRMAKIENHALHNRTLVDRMTEEERSYLRQYGELLEKHYRRTVLNHLPKEAWKKLDEPEMIDSPDLEQFIFCRVIETVQIDVTGEPNALNEDLANDDDDFGDNIQEHAAGSFLIVMYKQVRDLVLEGKVELLM
mmetsp:Transcript_14774/g.32105  ORF Transcript_14774/g.32105 Transcript_14774/m.32105 type:complete len:323 (+) Transcript_14774:148-1116(+)|eukprot:CAMPEP_0172312872 /NCGR_PEP_ID=MMETSP1058-20130122/18706_1 /TAXON_ID=83371 /ORGANISM="Detonula confervacea, Strain CCMP 353" /LENGTH=322 /DNA_ID=CAMNT_0013026427 /DNA_START=87 /DNA_END=1055 /DNA_ORIENTATION=+